MKKICLLILCSFNVILVHAVDILYPVSGSVQKLNLPTEYLQTSNYIVNAESIGVQDCNNGILNAFLTLDNEERDEIITVESISTNSTMWSYWSVGSKLPFNLSNNLAINGRTKNMCPDILIQLQNQGAVNYKYYMNQNSQCVLAQTRDEALCKAGCIDCIGIKK